MTCRMRYLLVWLVMLAISIANGALRDFTYGKYFSELHKPYHYR